MLTREAKPTSEAGTRDTMRGQDNQSLAQARPVASVSRRSVLPLMVMVALGLFVGARADEPRSDESAITVAVASNFVLPARSLAERFSAVTNTPVRLTTGSTGALVAQAANGAPFDVLLAADLARPQVLVARGLTRGVGVVPYARGRLVLWAPRSTQPLSSASISEWDRYAIANPLTAPYGAAAAAVLDALAPDATRLRGENVGQAYAMIASGNVAAGFVAASQVLGVPDEQIWRVPAELHPPIDQGAVVLAGSRAAASAEAFLKFVLSAEGQTIVASFGYIQPNDQPDDQPDRVSGEPETP